MAQDILINAGVVETRVAILSDGKLQDFFLDRTLGGEEGARAGASLVGDIVLGRVERVVPAVQAAFVDIGLERAGFLGAREARCLAERDEGDEPPPIAASVREGDAVLVQITKDPMGEKGARLTASITLPGRMVVLAPYQDGVALSRRIEDEAERARLQTIVEKFADEAGYIVRTAAINASKQELETDAQRLLEAWREIETEADDVDPPATLYRDLSPVARTLRDYVLADTARVIIDDREAFAEAQDYAKHAMPEAAAKLQLHQGEPLFEKFNIEGEIEALINPRVNLPGGGWINIESTEALTAIDVNSGRMTDTSALEETALRTNVEAAAEIGRQLRLRGIGGLVAVDFMKLAVSENAARVIAALGKGMALDKAPTQISEMSGNGLVEITRKRMREPLARLLTEPAENGMSGRMKSASTIASEFFRRIEREARANPGRTLNGLVSLDILDWIEDQGAAIPAALTRRGIAQAKIQPREEWPREKFDVAVE